MMNNYIRWGIAIAGIVFISYACLLFSTDTFGYHDSTQAGRVYDFSLNLIHGYIPPRIAPTFSYEMGYPIFNHYAPTAYWITSFIHLVGFSIPVSLEISFVAAVVVGVFGMYLFARQHMGEWSSFVAAFLYGSSPFMAAEIFVRGNLAELWFLAFLPVTLYLLHKGADSRKHGWIVALAFSFMAFMMTHNALSIVGGAVVLLYAVILKNKRVWLALSAGLGMAAHFLVPAVLELSQTHAADVATKTLFTEHFVCLRQLWDSPWGFGGSMAGCVDGMSFQIGKVLLVLGLLGIGLWIYKEIGKAFQNTQHILLACVTLFSLLLMTDASAFIWKVGEPLLKLFQFPWRFLGLSIFGLAFFAGLGMEKILPKKQHMIGSLVICTIALILSIPYFVPNPDKKWSERDFTQQFLSMDYMRNEIAYRVPEYVPRSVSFDAWMALKDDPLKPTSQEIVPLDGELYTVVRKDPFRFEVATSSRDFIVSKHLSQVLSITVNGNRIPPADIDDLGRPHFIVDTAKNVITVEYVQTQLEIVSNAMSLLAFGLLLLPYIRSWKKNN